jgi:2-keto-4-pentenoate hydratase/2-oxohepta-3-ene-1,7-dioic acid hydratase in catechol pathway
LKLCSYQHNGSSSFGIVKEGGVIDLAPLFKNKGISNLHELLKSDGLDECEGLLDTRAADYSLDDIQFEPVIPNPPKILCVGVNYHEHKVETGQPDTVYPMFFPRYPESQVGHMRPMIKPPESNKLDYEGEMALIIGKPGRRITEEDALSHIAGYSCYNDGSVRDWQRHTSQFMPGKNFVGTGSFGPWMVTSDEIPDPTQLQLTTRLNDMTVQDASVEQMITPIPELIAYISTVMPLNIGDVIVTGTPGGVGSRRTPPLYMKEGDTVEVEISQIGILRNTIENE